MSQISEKDDPRQVPPKQYGSTESNLDVGDKGNKSKTGGMHDDVDDSRGAIDRQRDDSGGKSSGAPGSSTDPGKDNSSSDAGSSATSGSIAKPS